MGSSDFDRIFGRFSSQPAFDTHEFVPGGRMNRPGFNGDLVH